VCARVETQERREQRPSHLGHFPDRDIQADITRAMVGRVVAQRVDGRVRTQESRRVHHPEAVVVGGQRFVELTFEGEIDGRFDGARGVDEPIRHPTRGRVVDDLQTVAEELRSHHVEVQGTQELLSRQQPFLHVVLAAGEWTLDPLRLLAGKSNELQIESEIDVVAPDRVGDAPQPFDECRHTGSIVLRSWRGGERPALVTCTKPARVVRAGCIDVAANHEGPGARHRSRKARDNVVGGGGIDLPGTAARLDELLPLHHSDALYETLHLLLDARVVETTQIGGEDVAVRVESEGVLRELIKGRGKRLWRDGFQQSLLPLRPRARWRQQPGKKRRGRIALDQAAWIDVMLRQHQTAVTSEHFGRPLAGAPDQNPHVTRSRTSRRHPCSLERGEHLVGARVCAQLLEVARVQQRELLIQPAPGNDARAPERVQDIVLLHFGDDQVALDPAHVERRVVGEFVQHMGRGRFE
jgi:hypothetical protein